MKKIKLTRIITATLITVSVLALNPIGASAEWKEDSNGWWYSEGSSWIIGERFIDGHKYYFNKNGYMKTGWRATGTNWFYYDNYGYQKKGWLQDGGKWYYLNPTAGYMVTNRAVDGWYLNSDGVGVKCESIGGYEIDKSTCTITKYTGNDTSLVIPREIGGIQIKRIEGNVFGGRRNLTNITIPDSVTYVDGFAFYNCYNLKSIIVDDNNKDYAGVDGVLFNKSREKIINYPMGKENKSYIIPSNVNYIQSGAFKNCINLTSIKIPTGISSMRNDIFENCSNATFYIEDEKTKKYLISCGVPTSKIILDSQISGSIQTDTNNSNASSMNEISNKSIEPLKDDTTFKAINSLEEFDTTKSSNIKIRLSNIRPLGYYKLIEPFNDRIIVSKAKIDSNNLQSKIESQLFMGTFNDKVFIFADSKCTKDKLDKDWTYIVKGSISSNGANEIIGIKQIHSLEAFYWKWFDTIIGGRYIDCSQKVIDFATRE